MSEYNPIISNRRRMLKHSACNPDINVFLTYSNFFLDPYKDPEVEEWAAIKIQRSFKDFKHQKSRTSLAKSDSVSTNEAAKN